MSPQRRRRLPLFTSVAIGLVVVALSACSDGGGSATTADGATRATSTATAQAADDDGSSSDGENSDDTTDSTTGGFPGDAICDALPATVVSKAIAHEITGTDGYGLGTPQCSYSFNDNGTITTVSVAAQRTDDDLGGRTGRDALELAVTANQAIPDNNAEAADVSIDGAEAAVAIDGDVISGVIILAENGRIYTVFSPALDAERLEALATASVSALAD